jgi:hypothetical protein
MTCRASRRSDVAHKWADSLYETGNQSDRVAAGERAEGENLCDRPPLFPVMLLDRDYYWCANLMLDPFGQRALGRIATLKIICDRIRSLAALGHFLGAEARN